MDKRTAIKIAGALAFDTLKAVTDDDLAAHAKLKNIPPGEAREVFYREFRSLQNQCCAANPLHMGLRAKP